VGGQDPAAEALLSEPLDDGDDLEGVAGDVDRLGGGGQRLGHRVAEVGGAGRVLDHQHLREWGQFTAILRISFDLLAELTE
jgi:hypothetical protein